MSFSDGPQYVEPERNSAGFEPVEQVVYPVAEAERFDDLNRTPLAGPPAGGSLRWLWWLLGLLMLASLIWALVHRCDVDHASHCPEPSGFDAARQAQVVSELEPFMPGLSANYHNETVAAMHDLCVLRLTHGGEGEWSDFNSIQYAFRFLGDDMDSNAIAAVRTLVNGSSYCYCVE
jgi:hypothetical protein